MKASELERQCSAEGDGTFRKGNFSEDRLTGFDVKAPSTPVAMRILRRAVFALLRRTDQRAQIRITNFLKSIRRKRLEKPLFYVSPSYCLAQAYRLSGQHCQTGLQWPASPGFVCLTHDLDWIECQDFAAEIAEVEGNYGVRSTFNFLTHWNYMLDRELVLDLARAGFEIGLHGSEHDIALAYRSHKEIYRSIQKALDALPLLVRGYRSPALSSSEELYAVLHELNFVYDSSSMTRDPYGGGTGLCLPYLYPGHHVWEIPLTLQDSTLFRDLCLSDAEALSATVELMKAVVEIGGVFVFNGHPGILKNHMEFYRLFLEEAVAFQVLKMDEGIEHWKRRLMTPREGK